MVGGQIGRLAIAQPVPDRICLQLFGHAWDKAGHRIGDDCGGDPYARLLGRLDLLGASFHVEADQVNTVDEDNEQDADGDAQDSVLPGELCHYPELVNLAGGAPLETVEIPGLPGRRYVLYVYPFCA